MRTIFTLKCVEFEEGEKNGVPEQECALGSSILRGSFSYVRLYFYVPGVSVCRNLK